MKHILTLAFLSFCLLSNSMAQQAEQFFQKGIELQDAGEYSAAIEYYSAAIGNDPRLNKAMFNRALCQMGLKNLNKASSDLEKILEQNPDDIEAMELRANIHLEMRQWKDAIRLYTKVLDNRSLFEPLLNRGMAKLQIGDHQGAEEDFFSAQKMKPFNDEVFFGLGELCRQKGFHVQALSYYEQALKLKPEDYEAIHNCALTKASMGDYRGAIFLFEQAKKLYSEASIYANCALAKIQSGDLQGGIVDAEQAIRLDANYAPAYFALGFGYLRDGFFVQAIPEFNHAILLDKMQPDYFYYRAMAHFQLDDPGSAEEDCQQALAVKPNHPEAMDLLQKCQKN